MKQFSIKNLILAALFLALGILLPMLFHVVGAGSAFLPMHIPVLLCGLICGWQYGALCGFIVPLLSSLFTGMPPIFPTAPAMMLELCAYGVMTGLLYRRAKQNIYVSLIGSMLAGRVVSGLANAVFMGMAGKAYGFSMFLTGAFVTALPGIVIQLIAVPLIVMALEKAHVLEKPRQLA
ncbi:MAG: ECF transporter S component [Oscillospiraceae bacterium]